MPRDLGKKDNTITIEDPISGSTIRLFYRTPKASEIQEYYSASYTEEDGVRKSNAVVARVGFAKKILTGFDDGDFTIEGQPISSNLSSENYRENWRDILEDEAADLLDGFILNTFDMSKLRTNTIPLAKSSGA